MSNKDEWIKLRISAEDKALFTEHAEEEGLSLSAWMRSRLRQLVRNSRPHGAVKAKKRVGK